MQCLSVTSVIFASHRGKNHSCNFKSFPKSTSPTSKAFQIDIPYIFMHLSDCLMRNIDCGEVQTDIFFLLKYILCTSSEVYIMQDGKVTETIYHPIRHADFVLLEQSIRFYPYVFEFHNCNVREFVLCPFEMVNVSDWHISGIPLLMSHHKKKSKTSAKLSMAPLANTTGKIFTLERTPEEMHFTEIHTKVCASCYNNNKKRKLDGASYDTFFLEKWEVISEELKHGVLFKNINRSANFVLCNKENEMSLVFSRFYQKISRKFPVVFQQRNMTRYYARLIADYKADLLKEQNKHKQQQMTRNENKEDQDDTDDMEQEIIRALAEDDQRSDNDESQTTSP